MSANPPRLRSDPSPGGRPRPVKAIRFLLPLLVTSSLLPGRAAAQTAETLTLDPQT